MTAGMPGWRPMALLKQSCLFSDSPYNRQPAVNRCQLSAVTALALFSWCSPFRNNCIEITNTSMISCCGSSGKPSGSMNRKSYPHLTFGCIRYQQTGQNASKPENNRLILPVTLQVNTGLTLSDVYQSPLFHYSKTLISDHQQTSLLDVTPCIR